MDTIKGECDAIGPSRRAGADQSGGHDSEAGGNAAPRR